MSIFPFSYTGQQPGAVMPNGSYQNLQSFFANNPTASQQSPAPQNSSLDPLQLGSALGQHQGPMGLPPIDPVGGITNGMGVAGKVLNPAGMLFGSGGLFG